MNWRHPAYQVLGRTAAALGRRLESPLFVVGTGRCGSTLLASILDSHGELCRFPGEANELWHPMAFPYGQRKIELPPMVADPAQFSRRSLAAWPAGQERKIRHTLLGFFQTRPGRRALCVKSAMISFLVPKIREIYPDGRFIHLYRNGPSVVASWVEKEWSKYRQLFPDRAEFRRSAAGYWVACLEELDRQAQSLGPDGMMEVRYEQLCERPEEVAGEIARFAGLDPNGFRFDFSRVASRDYKAAGVAGEPEWAAALEVMSATMRSKGYSLPGS